MQPRGPLVESRSGMPSAFDVTMPKTLAETTWHLAQIPPLTASPCRISHALAVFARRLGFPRRLYRFVPRTTLDLLTVAGSRCWDGKNLDSPDHTSHVSYPASGTFESNGPCPATHPVKLPQLMFEVIWDTTAFNDKQLWPQDGSQPFVFSQGDA